MTTAPLHVAVGVVRNGAGEILIARRPAHLHQGGLWEFPGGKVEAGETVQQALARELEEELGIQVADLQPLIRIAHHYPERHVLLDVWDTTTFSGEAHGREGQSIAWVTPQGLDAYPFPAANRAIVRAVQLPAHYLVTGDYRDDEDFHARLERALSRGIRLVQLRDKSRSPGVMQATIARAMEQCHRHGARLLLNGVNAGQRGALAADGLHLTSQQLGNHAQRPVPADCLLGASVHNLEELQQAMRLEVDFVVLSPVLPTASHPRARPLGWAAFAELAEVSTVPVYALGGMTGAHTMTARQHGGQGIAAIRAFWPED